MYDWVESFHLIGVIILENLKDIGDLSKEKWELNLVAIFFNLESNVDIELSEVIKENTLLDIREVPSFYKIYNVLLQIFDKSPSVRPK